MNTISVICVYNNEEILNEYLLKSLNKQTEKFELITIDNRFNKFTSAASALNYGGSLASGKYLIFTHQDINLTKPNWIKETLEIIEKLEKPGIIGVAGKHNNRFVHSNIKHGLIPFDVSWFKLKHPESASTVDECLFIIPKEVFDKYKFDEKTCFDWHLYATDYLLTIKKEGYNSYIIPSFLEHRSPGNSLSEGYYKTLPKLQKKHFSEKIIYNCVDDWYTFIPIFIQKYMKKYNEKNNFVKINPIDKYVFNKIADKEYKTIPKDKYNLIKNSGLFDEEYYTNRYKLDWNKYDPLTHFSTVGFQKMYNPSMQFDIKDYYYRYPDVRKANINPILHYISYGIDEGRTINPTKALKVSLIEKLLHSSQKLIHFLFK